MPDVDVAVFRADCRSRLILDQIADKWSVLILASLCSAPLRFNALKRRMEGVTHKALTQALRRLERSGIISRRVLPGPPLGVEYALTPLGVSLKKPFEALYAWTTAHEAEVIRAQQRFDAKVRRTSME